MTTPTKKYQVWHSDGEGGYSFDEFDTIFEVQNYILDNSTCSSSLFITKLADIRLIDEDDQP